MPIVPAKCPQCGANIDIDNTHVAGICQYCGTAFVTEKAINHFNNTYNIQHATINVTGVDVDNLLIRASQFESQNNTEKALEYYNRILDVDAYHPVALECISRLTRKAEDNAPSKPQKAKEIAATSFATAYKAQSQKHPAQEAGKPAKQSEKKSRRGMKIGAIICFVFALIYVIISLERSWYVSAAGFFGILCGMLYVLSLSPKSSKYLFGKKKGIRKGLFVFVCIIAAIYFVGAVDNACDHEYVVISETPASAEADGEIVRECSKCGKEDTTTIEKPEQAETHNATSGSVDATYAQLEPDYVISIEELVNEIETDIEAAKQKYNGKCVEITGAITYISDSSGMTGFYLYGERGSEDLSITCWVYDESEQEITDLDVGDIVTFIGILREVTTFNNTEIGECIVKQYTEQ